MGMFVLIFGISIIIGILGSMRGIGGGVFLIPVLSGLIGLPIKTAIGASIVSVIATSSAAGAVYIGRGMTHSRLAMVLEIATTFGALAGGITAILLSARILAGIFAVVLLYVACTMGRGHPGQTESSLSGLLDTTYIDPLTGQPISYGVHNLPAGMVASFLAGNISGLLGIGGGVIKVPVMNLIMRIPLRAAIATSNFMIGITAATSALIYSGKVRKFTPEEVNFAIAVADIGAIAIENAKLHEVLKQRLAALKEDVDGWYQFLAFS